MKQHSTNMCRGRLQFIEISCAALQADAPVTTGNGINWYGGPVLNNKAGIVVRCLRPAHKSLITSQMRRCLEDIRMSLNMYFTLPLC